MAKIHSTLIDVIMDDGRELVAEADQRDFAAWEAAPENDPDNPRRTTMIRWLSWNALKRAGETKATFKAFNERECVQAMVQQIEEEEAGSEEEAGEENPTRG